MREINFYDKARALIDWMEKSSIEEPPIGLSIQIENYWNEDNIKHETDNHDLMSNFNITMGKQSSYIDDLNKACKKLSCNEDIMNHNY